MRLPVGPLAEPTASAPATPIRIALISPWPPDASGIADFARDLALGLVDAGYGVDVFTHNPEAVGIDGATLVHVPSDWDGAELDAHSFRLYQLGNHADYHAWMMTALLDKPGVVQVHDFVLHHLLIGLTQDVDDWPSYVRAVREWYGDDVAVRAEMALFGKAVPLWESAEVIDYPFFEFFVSHADAAIVHSRFAASRIVKRLPRIPMRQVDQTYRHQTSRVRTSLIRIGIFGGVQENKKLDWIIEAFNLLGATLASLEVTVVGTVASQSEVLVARAKDVAHLSIHFIGRVDEQRFIDELERTDLCISLRHPTMGETSAVVMRALQHGVPTIVSDTGWYAELPPEVKKIPLDNAAYVLASVIAKLLAEPDLYAEWAAACMELPNTLNLSHGRMVEEIAEFLQSYRAERLVSDHVASHLSDLGFIGDEAERYVLKGIAQRSVL